MCPQVTLKHTHTHTHTEREKDIHTHIHTNRQTHTQSHTHTHTHTHTHLSPILCSDRSQSETGDCDGLEIWQAGPLAKS